MNRRSVLDDPQIRAELAQAWQDSMPGPIGGVEIGGFVVEDAQGHLLVVRWPPGTQDEIDILPHPGCKIGGLSILATFHTLTQIALISKGQAEQTYFRSAMTQI